jgi:hypothetical protein
MTQDLARVVQLLDNYKARAAFLAPFVGGLGVMVTNWITSGQWDEAEFRILLGGLSTGVFTSVVTWFVPAGNAQVEIIPGTVEVNDSVDVPSGPVPEGDVTKFSDNS